MHAPMIQYVRVIALIMISDPWKNDTIFKMNAKTLNYCIIAVGIIYHN
jgi:hypothetical protein